MLTLLFGLVLLLVLREEHVVGETAAGHCALQTHTVRFACQATCAEAAVGERHTALALHVDWTLGFCALGFGFVLLLLFRAGLLCVVELALFALLCARLKALDGRLPRPNVVIVLALLFPESSVFRFLCFLLLSLLICFLIETIANMRS